MSDLLDIEKLNDLPYPIRLEGFPVLEIDVESGLVRIDVCGLAEIRHFSDYIRLSDGNGVQHDCDDFYVERIGRD